MSTGKLIVLTIAWVLASVAMGVVIGILVTETLVLVGVVDSGTSQYRLTLNISTFTAFVVVVAIPFVFRGRFTS
jgi:hypothetical protein